MLLGDDFSFHHMGGRASMKFRKTVLAFTFSYPFPICPASSRYKLLLMKVRSENLEFKITLGD